MIQSGVEDSRKSARAGSSESKARLRRYWVWKGTSVEDSASRGRLGISGKGKLTRLRREERCGGILGILVRFLGVETK